MSTRLAKIILPGLTLAIVSMLPLYADMRGLPNPNAQGYWTEQRMKEALPIELIVDAATGVGKLQPAFGANSKGTATTSGSTTIQATTDWPQGQVKAQKAVGKVFFTVGAKDYVCSGALVSETDTARAIVQTAGHCVWDQAKGQFVSNWAFVPDYDSNSSNPRWYASALFVRNEFASQTSFNNIALANDWAFAVLVPGVLSNGDTLPDFEGNAYPYSESGFSNGDASVAFGYPAARPYNGLSLKYAAATIFTDSNTNLTWGMNSDMTGGASGGPWLSKGSDNSISWGEYGSKGALTSLNSYKYTTDSKKMYGPKFNVRTTATLQAALSASVINIRNTKIS